MNKHELNELLGDHQIYHSDFQMDHFITGLNGGTAYGMYVQALRELDKRYRGLKQLYIERERLNLKIETFDASEAAWHEEFDSHGVKEDALKLLEARLGLEDLERNIRDTEREFGRFFAQARALKEQVGPLTQERRAELEVELWTHRLKARAAVETMTGGRLGPNTVESVMALPPALRARVLSEIRDPEKLIPWFQQYEAPVLDLPAIETPGDVRALLESSGG